MTDPPAYEHIPSEMRRAEAREAVTNSMRKLDEVLATSDEVTRVSRSLREIRIRNRFAERIETSMRRREAS